MPTESARDDPRRLHKSPEAVRELLDRLDESFAGSDKVNARRSDRYTYRIRSLEVDMAQPGSGWVRYEVPSRNLSREGAAFLLGHFVYPGTTCRIHLVSLQNLRQVISGRVVRCRYLEGSGTLHEVGVHFDQVIDVALYNRQAARLRFLLVDDDQSIHRLIDHWLKTLDVELMHVENGRTAVEMASTSPFDLILLDMELGEFSGIETARELRQQGYARPIVMITAMHGDETRDQCLAAGANQYLAKPLTRDDLLKTIESLRDNPLHSSMADDADFEALISTFVSELPEKVGQLERTFSQNDFNALATAVRVLKGEGGAYGFQALTDAATEVEKAISEALDANEIRSRLVKLIRLCLSARSIRSAE